MTKAFVFALVLAAAACGSKKSEPATSTTTSEKTGSADQMMAEHHAEMANMPPELGKFHDVLAPHWHADQGPQRMKDTCAALPEFHANAEAVAKATPPTTANADKWTAGTRELTAAVGGLDDVCKGTDEAQFDAAFEKVHVAFHGLLEQAGGHHMEHGEGHEGMEHEHGM